MRYFAFFCAAVLAAFGVSTGTSSAATTQPMTYAFTTSTYEQVFDHYRTPIQYSQSMNIEMSVTLSEPLQADLSNVALSPDSWSYDDGIYDETGSDLSRFNGFVSTNAAGEITEFLVQLYLDAPNHPGVWVRRDGSGDAYATAFAQEILVGLTDPCWRHSSCGDPIPTTEWAQDRATGTGDIYVSSFAVPDDPLGSTGQSSAASAATVPLPAPILLLGFAVGGLGALRARRPA